MYSINYARGMQVKKVRSVILSAYTSLSDIMLLRSKVYDDVSIQALYHQNISIECN